MVVAEPTESIIKEKKHFVFPIPNVIEKILCHPIYILRFFRFLSAFGVQH